MTTASPAANTLDRDDIDDDELFALFDSDEQVPPRPAKAAPAAPPPANYVPAVRQWLEWQCQMISGVHRGVVFVLANARSDVLDSAVFWPEEGGSTTVLRDVASKALRAGRGVVQKALDEDSDLTEVCDYVAYPVTHEDRLAGIIVLAIEIRSEAQRQAVLQLVEWGSMWLEAALGDLRGQSREAASLALTAIGDLAQDIPLPLAAHKLCTLLADNLECARVALGLTAGMQVQLVGISHQLQFDRRMKGMSRIETAMEECIDQGEPLSLPVQPGREGALVKAHEYLQQELGHVAVCSVPLLSNGQAFGALTLVWDRPAALDERMAQLAGEIAQRVAPVIELKRREGRSGLRRVGGRSLGLAKRLFGPGHLRLKLGLLAVVLALGISGLTQTDYRVSARSTIEGTLQQAIVAPLAGYLASASARAGDRVEAGQVLAVLDDRELLLERERWQSERDKHAKEYQEALATRDRAKITIGSARIAQAEAQLKLVEEQRARLTLQAPFSGTLVSGDLSRALGAPLERGQLLFEIVPNDAYRVSLQVDEHDMAGLEPGQQGRLRLAGLPDTAIPFEITRIVPVASAEQGTNHFRVEGELKEIPEGLRPGMQGVAKVVTGRGSLLWSWTRELTDRLRLWLWSVGF